MQLHPVVWEAGVWLANEALGLHLSRLSRLRDGATGLSIEAGSSCDMGNRLIRGVDYGLLVQSL